MRDAKQHFTAIKNRATSHSAQTWVTARCDVGTLLMHAECKAA